MVHYTGLAAALAVVSLASPAPAHVTLEQQRATVGSSYKATLRVSHGCNGSPTTRLVVQIPEGYIGVRPMPKAGWQLQVTRGGYARSYPHYHGAQLSEGVREVTWTGRLLDEHYDEFVLSGLLARDLAPDQRLYFPVTQECEQGSQRWVEQPSAGQDAHALKFPAAGLTLVAQAQAQTQPAQQAATDSFKVGALLIEAPWSRATPGGAKVAGGYMTITNTGTETDRLVGGTFPETGRFEVHEMSMDNGVMRMRQLAAGLEIKPGQKVELKPGGLHVMFMDLKRALKEGDVVKGTLIFEKAGRVEVAFKVGRIGASGAGGSGGRGHSHH